MSLKTMQLVYPASVYSRCNSAPSCLENWTITERGTHLELYPFEIEHKIVKIDEQGDHNYLNLSKENPENLRKLSKFTTFYIKVTKGKVNER